MMLRVTDWFQSSRVKASSWSEVTSGTVNVFSIAVTSYLTRRFLINKLYCGCPNNNGYMVVSDSECEACEWETHPEYPHFLYSKINSADNWERLMFGRADFLAICVYILESISFQSIVMSSKMNV